MKGGLLFKHIKDDHFLVKDGSGKITETLIKLNKEFIVHMLEPYIVDVRMMKKKDLLPLFIKFKNNDWDEQKQRVDEADKILQQKFKTLRMKIDEYNDFKKLNSI